MFLGLFQPIFMGDYGYLKGTPRNESEKVPGKEKLKKKDRFVLIDASLFRYYSSGKLTDRISNPLYLIYLTLYKRPEMIQDMDIDFIAFFDNRVLRFNPAKMDKKQLPKFLMEIKKLYRNQEEEPEIESQIADAIQEENNFVKEENKTAETPIETKELDKETKPKSTEKVTSPKEKVLPVNNSSVTKPVGAKKLTPSQLANPTTDLKIIADNLDQASPELKKKVDAVYTNAKKEVTKAVSDGTTPPTNVAEKVAEKAREEIDNDEELLNEYMKDINNIKYSKKRYAKVI